MLMQGTNVTVRDSQQSLFESLNFQIDERDRIQILGNSGHGISLFLKFLAGLAEGVHWDGRLILAGDELIPRNLNRLSQQGVFYLPRSAGIFEQLSNKDNLMIKEQVGGARWEMLQGHFPTQIDWDRLAKHNSERQNQWLSLFRCFMQSRRLVLIDSALDALSKTDRVLFIRLLDVFCPEAAIVLPLAAADFVGFRPKQLWTLDSKRLTVTTDTEDENTRSVRVRALRKLPGGNFPPKNKTSKAEKILEVKNSFGTSLRFHRGEIVGLLSQSGSGIARSLLNAEEDLTLKWNGKSSRMSELAIEYISGFRTKFGLWKNQSVSFNLSFPHFLRQRRILLKEPEEESFYQHYRQVLRLSTSSSRQSAGACSRDDQQRILVGRAVALKPEVLIVEEATRGMTTRTKQSLYFMFRDLADFGVAIVWVTQDALEIEGLCHRAYIIRGQMEEAVEVHPDETSLETLLEKAVP